MLLWMKWLEMQLFLFIFVIFYMKSKVFRERLCSIPAEKIRKLQKKNRVVECIFDYIQHHSILNVYS